MRCTTRRRGRRAGSICSRPGAGRVGQPPDTFLGRAGAAARRAAQRPGPARAALRVLVPRAAGSRSAQRPSGVDAAAVSASMASALLAYSGISVKMLLDERHGAHLGTMFMVDYHPRVVLHAHDHPIEEAFYMLEGEVVYIADGAEHRCGRATSPSPAWAASTRSRTARTSAAAGWRRAPRCRRSITPTASSATGTTSPRWSARDRRRRDRQGVTVRVSLTLLAECAMLLYMLGAATRTA